MSTSDRIGHAIGYAIGFMLALFVIFAWILATVTLFDLHRPEIGGILLAAGIVVVVMERLSHRMDMRASKRVGKTTITTSTGSTYVVVKEVPPT